MLRSFTSQELLNLLHLVLHHESMKDASSIS